MLQSCLKRVGLFIALISMSFNLTAWSSSKEYPELGLGPLKDSAAYRSFLNRPLSEYSKVKYLVDRFKSAPVQINYDGHNYRLKDISGIVEMYMRCHYDKKRSAKEWVMEYANRTLSGNKPILLRLEDGASYQTGHVLLSELNRLERTLSSR